MIVYYILLESNVHFKVRIKTGSISMNIKYIEYNCHYIRIKAYNGTKSFVQY